ncbi:MAG: class I SAM-dependent methyltransferase [Chitinophagaceae bacterium]|nr:class I SAM-dependent methyltransferase [Chitinophagaceae bacterium]
MNHNTPSSPITKGAVKLLYTIQTSELLRNYLKESSIDISCILKDVDKIGLYECLDTSYRFFFPFNIAGDGPFYEKLEMIPWYYADWKWDYDIANNYITHNSSVLDIGCGEGKFIKHLKLEKNCNCFGLELNEKASDIAKVNGLQVLNQTIQEFALYNKEKFDYVTFFQVLEHISDVDSFLSSAIDVVKREGKIILAVPNNDPYYLTYDKDHYLNLPPHHMGWWNKKSLISLCNFYNLKLETVVIQPLEHYSSYANNLLSIKMKLPEPLVLLLRPFVKFLVYMMRKKINGASILAVYRKL